MKKVWKFPLALTDIQPIDLPRMASLLTVQIQDGAPKLWALVDDEYFGFERRYVLMAGTGHPVTHPNLGNYLGTIQLKDGALVFHFFEVFAP